MRNTSFFRADRAKESKATLRRALEKLNKACARIAMPEHSKAANFLNVTEKSRVAEAIGPLGRLDATRDLLSRHLYLLY